MTDFDYSILKNKLAKSDRTAFATALGMSDARLESLLSGRGEFRADEIIQAARLLGLESKEVDACFFSEKVQNK